MLPESRGCPLCRRDVAVGELLTGPELDADLGALIAANTPGWTPAGGACRECARRFATARDELGRHGVSSGAILPTPLRLAAPDRYRGRGVTVAFLDSGFYAHPDLRSGIAEKLLKGINLLLKNAKSGKTPIVPQFIRFGYKIPIFFGKLIMIPQEKLAWRSNRLRVGSL